MEVAMDQIRELHNHYVEAGLGETSSGRFLRSITVEGRMPRGRGEDWLRDLITKGNPQSVSHLVAEIEDLMLRSKRQDTTQILADILGRVKSGWTLTDHKKSELERLRKQVNDALPDLELSGRQVELLFGLGVRKHRSSYNYWASRPVISSRLDDIFKRWGSDLKISPDDWQFVRDNFKSVVEEFEGERHPVGALRWSRGSLTAYTIMGLPRFNDGGVVVIETLQAGRGVVVVPAAGLLIRPPKLVQR